MQNRRMLAKGLVFYVQTFLKDWAGVPKVSALFAQLSVEAK